LAKIEGTAPVALSRSGKGSRAGQPSATSRGVSKLDPAEKFLAFVIREVIRHHESVPRTIADLD
jgi:hypothetical protein